MAFQTFSLLATPQVFKEVVTEVGGGFEAGLPVEGTITRDYVAIEGFQEPYTRSESSDILPSGVKSDESLYLYTNEDLALHNDLTGNQTIGDTVYLEDPRINTNALPYLAYDKENWKANTNMQLITQNYCKVILIRKEKLLNGGIV